MDYSLYILERKEDLTRLANTIRSKNGGTSPLTVVQMKYAISEAGFDDPQLVSLIERSASEIVVPDEVVKIRRGFLAGFGDGLKITMPAVGHSDSTDFIFGDLVKFTVQIGDSSYETYGNIGSIDTLTLTRQGYTESGGDIGIYLSDKAFVGTSLIYYTPSVKDLIFGSGFRSISDDSCYGMTSLKTVQFNEGLLSIGGLAFSGCTGLTTVTIPSSVTGLNSFTFSNCTGLSSVVFKPKFPCGTSVFSGCTSLREVLVPWAKDQYSDTIMQGFLGTGISTSIVKYSSGV